MREWPKAELDQIRSIGERIKACPQEKTGGAVTSVYVGPPYNVTWDVATSESVRAPYTGYIELVVLYRDVVNPEACKKNPWGCEAIQLIPHRPLVLRYEYDLAPEGLNLVKALSRWDNESNWGNRTVGGSSCWERAARPAR